MLTGISLSMWNRIVDHENLYGFLRCNLDEDEQTAFANGMGYERFRFTYANASGHYSLNLGNENDQQVLRMITLLNGEESKFSKKFSKRGDTSQHGGFFNFRNEQLNKNDFAISSEFLENPPQAGCLQFDYVSTTRPHPDTEGILTRTYLC